jgi:hypothetical protein
MSIMANIRGTLEVRIVVAKILNNLKCVTKMKKFKEKLDRSDFPWYNIHIR